MSQKESEWEKELEKVMGCIPECASGLYEDVGCPAHGYDAMKSVKFFRGVLSNREKEIAEEVKKLIGFGKNGKDKVWVGNGNDCLYVERKAVLSLLKH